jgi:hypothetical protein
MLRDLFDRYIVVTDYQVAVRFSRVFTVGVLMLVIGVVLGVAFGWRQK